VQRTAARNEVTNISASYAVVTKLIGKPNLNQWKMGTNWEAPQTDRRKVITTGEGGMLTTSNPDFDQTFRLRRQHGMTVPDTVRAAGDFRRLSHRRL
jgi:hypothetical protein